MQDKYNVAIVGIGGSIGGLKPYEFDNKHTKNILTHAHAAYAHHRTELIAGIEPNSHKRAEVFDRWGCSVLSDIKGAVSFKEKADIVIVAVPTEHHYHTLLDVLEMKPKLVIAEKPFCNNVTESANIIYAYKKAGIPILVNYIRRYNPDINMIKTHIKSEGVQSCSVIYNRGLKRDGCHAIDLMNFFFGECQSKTILNQNKSYDDHCEEDRTYGVYLSYENCPHVFMFPADGRKFSAFEIDIVLNNSRINISQSSSRVSYYLTEPSIYGDYNALSDRAWMTKNTNLEISLMDLLGCATQYLDTGDKGLLRCTAEDALKTTEIINDLHSTI